jgi:hypothetical protein
MKQRSYGMGFALVFGLLFSLASSASESNEVFRKETEGKRYPELSSLLKARTIAEYIATLQR